LSQLHVLQAHIILPQVNLYQQTVLLVTLCILALHMV